MVSVQERLMNDIHRGIVKKDFSPFDIYQFIDKDKKELDNKIEQTERPDQIDRREFIIQVGEIGLTTLATYFSLLLKDAYAERTPEFLINFQKAYEDHIYRKEGNYLILRNGTRIQINDNIKKTPEQKLENADLEDQMLLPYYGGDYVQKNWQSLL